MMPESKKHGAAALSDEAALKNGFAVSLYLCYDTDSSYP